MEVGEIDSLQLKALTSKIQQGISKTKSLNRLPGGPHKGKKGAKNNQQADGHPPRSNKKKDAQDKAKKSKKPATKPSSSILGNLKVSETSSSQERLRREVIELGGTEEDLALVTGAKSDSQEVLDIISEEGVARNDVASFIKSIGIHTDASSEPEESSALPSKDQKGASSRGTRETAPRTPIEPVSTSTQNKNPSVKSKQLRGKASRLLLAPCPDWHAVELPLLPPLREVHSSPSQALVGRLHNYAMQLLQAENDEYSNNHLTSSSSHRFMSTIMSSGTLSDKVSALTLLIQESPLHNMKALERLLGLAKKRSRGQAVSALGALKDLLAQGELLPSNRRLKPFASQPALLEALQDSQVRAWKPGQSLPGRLDKLHLLLWAFEDWLKSSYFQIIQLLEVWCNDEVEFARARALGYVHELLTQKPEQEVNLLRLLVNKLGDTDRKIASKASFLLLQLQSTHPLMRPVIISTMESELIFRPRQNPNAIYYAIITLNQTVLSAQEEHVAVKLLDVYFGLFGVLLRPSRKEPPYVQDATAGPKQRGNHEKARKPRRDAATKVAHHETAIQVEDESREKIISAVLTGVNRAFPYSGSDETIVQTHLDTLYRITHSSNFNSSVQALMLLQQLSSTQRTESERFYRTLYESLLDPRLLTSSKQAMYLNVLFRSLKADVNLKRVKAFVKRLLQVVALHQAPFACGALYLIKELEETFQGLHGLITQSENQYDGDEEHFRDVPEDGTFIEKPSEEVPQKRGVQYDGRKRDPEYANADRSCLWELIPFLAHFHPSVQLFASRLLLNGLKPPKPDLSSHTLIHFLDRFVYRNVKAAPAPRGASIMQPLYVDNAHHMLLLNRDSGKLQAPLNTAEFLARRPEDVSVDEAFFHKYFIGVGNRKGATIRKPTKKVANHKGSDGEAEDDDNEVWKAIVGSRPEMGGEESDSEDVDLDDSDDSDDVDEVEEEGSDKPLVFDDDDASDLGSVSGSQAGADEINSAPDSDDDGVSGTDQASAEKFTRKRKQSPRRPETSSRSKRRKMKDLPVFASVDDYAEMLASEEEG